ncbi:tRNA lysidine(34) synthetase TilS [Alicyclobacillus sp. ALC3]|uniref:tRNA lysidine(34) synthetase TilS n=1 Tax=Alicyclobacillus sp. ALC3 TaxID=2796143 RepID=UPI0023787ECB|nr:tRNA lysidine(34) synthetase TilS [Alicyclobacillus sp. ALC3]WDL98977.1 tRNA lysidine(34) synthetase TilS [Alicyclobacillus sp. ALC3]
MPQAQNVVTAVKRFVAREGIGADGQSLLRQPLCIAVSGGVDSMVLLHVLCSLYGAERQLITVLHVHHHVRLEADDDARLVESFCHTLGVSSVVSHVDKDTVLASDSKGLEADLRQLRYAALVKAARSVGASAVCLAHHADDQLETVLWRLLRGTGGTGVGGMRDRGTRLGLLWLRPMLTVEKTDIYAYASEYSVPYAEDASNSSLQFTRNVLRHTVVPALKQIEPRAAEHIATFSRIVQEEDAWLDQEAHTLLASTALVQVGRARIDLTSFARAARPLQRRMIQILLYCLESGPISFAHVEQILHIATAETPSSEFLLDPTLLVRREYEFLWLERQSVAVGEGEAHYEETWQLLSGAVKELVRTPPAWSWRFTCETWHERGAQARVAFEAYIPQIGQLTLKTPCAGDRMLLEGGGHKKLQDVFVDAKVPRRLREQWPVFWLDTEVLWVPGVRRSAAHLVRDSDKDGYVIRAYPFMVRDASVSAPR